MMDEGKGLSNFSFHHKFQSTEFTSGLLAPLPSLNRIIVHEDLNETAE